MTRLSFLRTPHRHLPYGIQASADQNRKIVVVMGPTGSGKSKLSVDLVSRFFPSSEIVNSDKIQVYRGLDITTNKIPVSDRRGVHHYLLGEFYPSESHPEFTPSDFRSAASSTVSRILSRGQLPFVVGGSNSFIYALLAKKFEPELDVFSELGSAFCKELRYRCCFVWVDAAPPVLDRYLVKRVDDMFCSGMLDELSEYFANPESRSPSQCGLKKAIGVPEFEQYFQKLHQGRGAISDAEKTTAYGEAVRAIKDNTCQLAERQLGKILRLRDDAGWDLKRVDATQSLAAAMDPPSGSDGGDGDGGKRRVADIWEKQVVEPSVKIVKRFLME